MDNSKHEIIEDELTPEEKQALTRIGELRTGDENIIQYPELGQTKEETYEPDDDEEGVLVTGGTHPKKELSVTTKGYKIIKKIKETSDGKLVVKTGNIVGVIKYGQIMVMIGSRFDQPSDSELIQDNAFLSYLLAHAFDRVNLIRDMGPDLGKESMWDLLLVVAFAEAFEAALRRGPYWEYADIKRNDYNFQGRINVQEHLQQNIPFVGKVAYLTRKRVYDNPMMWLVRRTLDYIYTKHNSLWKVISGNAISIKEGERQVETVTPSYSLAAFKQIRTLSLFPIRHPLLGKEYEQLRRICIMLLRDEYLDLEESFSNKVWGIVFDIAKLWEKFVIQHLLNKIRLDGFKTKSGVSFKLFSSNKEIRHNKYTPDVVVEQGHQRIVLDAKYKQYIKNDSGNSKSMIEQALQRKRNDIYQVTTYMFLQKALAGGIVFPVEETIYHTLKLKHDTNYNRNGFAGEYYKFKDIPNYFLYLPFIVPTKTTAEVLYSELYRRSMEWTETTKSIIDDIFNNQFTNVIKQCDYLGN